MKYSNPKVLWVKALSKASKKIGWKSEKNSDDERVEQPKNKKLNDEKLLKMLKKNVYF